MPLKTCYHDLARRNPDVVKEEVIGQSLLGQADRGLQGHRRTRATCATARARRCSTTSTQHAREWIATEVEPPAVRVRPRQHKNATRGNDVKALLKTRELWFVPVVNPDGYDYTFTRQATRLWRKNLRDNNGDGQITNDDGVDPNRNWPEKWNYDHEGASDDLADGDLPRPGPGLRARGQGHARPRAAHRLEVPDRLPLVAQLILYPEGWQVETPATDAPLMEALAGDDDHPAVAGFDPDVSAELYTTNGDVTDDA